MLWRLEARLTLPTHVEHVPGTEAPMRPISFLILATCWAPLPRVAAQGPGARVRLTMVSASSRHLVGTLIAQDADSLWVQVPAHAAPVSVARSSVVLEVSRGRRRAIGQGAGIGAGLGLIGGLVLSSVAAGQADTCATAPLPGPCALGPLR